jgi:hypothetical protein
MLCSVPGTDDHDPLTIPVANDESAACPAIVIVAGSARTAEPGTAGVAQRAVPNGGMRVQVVPLEDV